MFNNRFNSTHKDPLVEAVRQAQQDGEIRRQAEALVNEEFGVYSRNAVVREQLAAYDAAIEEAYKCMKEAEKADKDYDKDGKIESPKDEVWGSRFRAAKKAGKMEEEQIDEMRDRPKKDDVNRRKRDAVAMKLGHNNPEGRNNNYNAPVSMLKHGRKLMKQGVTREETDYSAQDRAPVTKSAPKEDPSTPKSYPGAASSAPTAARLSNAKAAVTPIKEEDHLEEERKRTASVADAFMKGQKANQRTLRTDGKSVTYHGNTIAKHEGDEVHVTTAGHSHSPSTRGHINGILSRLGSDKLSVKKGQLHHGKNPVDHDAWIKVKKSTVSEESIDEAAYSAKSARAGKDIGKPGKMFAQIAAKAGQKYGSEERGKKVAGAILKKIRAKHMKEDSSFNSAQETGKTVNELAVTTPPVVQQPAPAVRGPAARLQGTKFYRGLRASTSGNATGQMVKPQTARATGPAPKTGTSLVPSSGNRLPTATSGASNVPATTASKSMTATQTASKGGSGFSYSRLGDRPMMGGMNPEDRIGGAFKAAAKGVTVRGIATKALGKAAGVAGLAVPDSTKTEPGNPVFRKTDAGKTQVAGYRSSTTPRAGTTDKNTQTGMTGSMSRRGGLAPSVKNQELPSKIAPVTTKSPGTLSAPAPKAATPKATPAPTPAPKAAAPEPKAEPKTFGQAFSAARKEAGGGKGQFEFGGKKYQTNVNPAKGSEKYIAPKAQKPTSVVNEPAPKSEPASSTEKGAGLTSSYGLKAGKTSDTSLSPDATKNQDTGMTPAKVNPEMGKQAAFNPTKSTGTSGMSSMDTIPGSTSPRRGTSDTGGFMQGSGSPTPTKVLPTKVAALKEEVQVGEYKYRIV